MNIRSAFHDQVFLPGCIIFPSQRHFFREEGWAYIFVAREDACARDIYSDIRTRLTTSPNVSKVFSWPHSAPSVPVSVVNPTRLAYTAGARHFNGCAIGKLIKSEVGGGVFGFITASALGRSGARALECKPPSSPKVTYSFGPGGLGGPLSRYSAQLFESGAVCSFVSGPTPTVKGKPSVFVCMVQNHKVGDGTRSVVCLRVSMIHVDTS